MSRMAILSFCLVFPFSIRVGTPLSYFISELLYVPEEELENVKTVSLHVVTVRLPNEPSGNHPDSFTSESNESNSFDQNCGGLLPASSCFPLHACSLNSGLSANVDKEADREDNKEKEEEEKQKEEEGGSHADERNKGHSGASVDDTSELAPPAKRPRTVQHADTSSVLSEDLPSAETVEGSFKETGSIPTVTNTPEGIPNNIDATVLVGDASTVLNTVLGQCSAWVLDIDLDFFSTGNPFKSLFTDVRFLCFEFDRQ